MVVGRPLVSTKLAAKAIRWLENVQFWLLPGTCVLCRKLSGQRLDLCESCHGQLPFITHACELCALPLPASVGKLCGHCLLQAAPFKQAIAPLAWAEPTSQLISRFKYHAQLAPGRVLGALLAHELRLHYADRHSTDCRSPDRLSPDRLSPDRHSADGHRANRSLPDLIVPVPLHPAKLRRRGYNQSLLLAQQLARALHRPCAPTLLRRLRDTPQQQGLSREARQQNLKGAFALDPAQAALHTEVHCIALVDDVVTTQSTAREIAAVLQQGLQQAPDIHLWALARA
jgi:ComF family protein